VETWEHLVVRPKSTPVSTTGGRIGEVPVEHLDPHEALLDALGAEGWQLVAVQEEHGPLFYLKRPRIAAE
jgi:hypothetical protein